jgi:hypothetical protein
MPIQFDDAAQHAKTLPNVGDRVDLFLKSIRDRLGQVTGQESKAALMKDLEDHHDAMVSTVIGPVGVTRLEAGTTPRMPGDPGTMVGDASPERAILVQIADLIRRMPGVVVASATLDPSAKASFLERDHTMLDQKMFHDDKPDVIVPGSETTREGRRFVSWKRADGTVYESLDVRPQNEPVG